MANCDSADGVTQVDLLVDNSTIASLHAAPYTFTTPGSLASGTHKIDIMCTTANQASATATANITVGTGCTTAAMCPKATDICNQGACIAGTGAQGGLGTACTGNPDCTSALCADNGTDKYCVIPTGQCPSGCSCVNAGAMGVCFPGGDGGGGGCLSASGSQAPLFLALGGVVAMITRRRKRS